MTESVRSPFLDHLLQLAPIEPGSGLRILELETEPQGGASAVDLATWAGLNGVGEPVHQSDRCRSVSCFRSHPLSLSVTAACPRHAAHRCRNGASS